MLQKGFFNTDPFNPSPYWDGTMLINLYGNEKYDQNTVFLPGRYEVLVQAGGCSIAGMSGKILETIAKLRTK
jgi:hypothetical protein